MWLPHLHTKGFGFIASTHSAAVIVRKRDDGFTQQLRPKKSLR